MTVFHQKSAAITSLDTTPAGRVTTGEGVAGVLKSVDAWQTPTDAAEVDSTIQMVRIPFEAIVKSITVAGAAQGGTGQFDVGVYYATDGSNGPAHPTTLLAADAIDQDLFTISALDFDDQAVYAHLVPGGGLRVQGATPAIDANTVWTEAKAHMRLWEALGLSANPGGNADIVLTMVEAISGAEAPIYLRVDYVL